MVSFEQLGLEILTLYPLFTYPNFWTLHPIPLHWISEEMIGIV